MIIFFGYYFLNRHFSVSIPCLYNELFGITCPGCGLTRMLFSLVKLDFVSAFHYNQFLFILFPFFIGFVLYCTYLYITHDDKVWYQIIPKFGWIILLLFTISWGIIRNLPMFPYLRP